MVRSCEEVVGNDASDLDKSRKVGFIVDSKNRRDSKKYTTRRASSTAESKIIGESAVV